MAMRTLLIHVYLICGLQLFAQEFYDRDSLWYVYKNLKPDTNKVKILIQLGQQYETNSPDSALLLYEQALRLSEQLGYTRGIISYYTNATYVYNVMSRYDTSLILNLKSVEIAREFGDPERLSACLGNVGASYMSLKEYEKAIDYFQQSSKIYLQLNDESKLGTLYSNLSVVYREIGQNEKAREYGEQALRLARKSNNVYAITSALTNLSAVYNSMGELSKSIAVLQEARELASESNNDYAFLITTLNLSDLHLQLADFVPMKTYCEDALALATKLQDNESIAIALRGLAIHYFNTGNVVEAEVYAKRSLQQALTGNFKEDIGRAYSVLAEISILKHDFKKNIFYSFKSDSVRNVLLNESVAQNIHTIEAKYQAEKREQEIKDLQLESEIKDLSIRQKQLVNYILGVALVAIFSIALLARRTYQQKQRLLGKENQVQQARIAQLESEKQLLASEAVIKGQDEERGRIAKDLHDGLGGLLSGVKFSLVNMKSNVILDSDSALVFERSLDMLDHSISELRRVAHNMMPEVLVKFGLSEALKSYCDSLRESKIYKIDFQSIGMEDRLASNTEIFIYRIIQELLNNISKHAQATQVLVQLARHDDELNVTVEDNGMGMDKNKLEQSAGAGWKNIHSRVEYLKGKLDVQSTAGQGTSIHITIPIV
jgi:two-component system NarL family sensor kinase